MFGLATGAVVVTGGSRAMARAACEPGEARAATAAVHWVLVAWLEAMARP